MCNPTSGLLVVDYAAADLAELKSIAISSEIERGVSHTFCFLATLNSMNTSIVVMNRTHSEASCCARDPFSAGTKRQGFSKIASDCVRMY